MPATIPFARFRRLFVRGIEVVPPITGTVAVNPAAIAATTRAATAVTIAGVKTGDVVIFEPPAALEDDILYVGCRVSAADTVQVNLYNPTGGSIDPASATWTYKIVKGS